MTAVNVRNRLGERFAVAGNWLFDGTTPERVVGGTFRVVVNANSAEAAIRQAEKMITADIIVTAIEMVRG